MKRILFSIFCISAFFLGSVDEAKATHYAGGDITYEYIGDSTNIPYHYVIYITLYRRELGAGFNSPISYNIESQCGNISGSADSIQGFGGVLPQNFAPCVDSTTQEYKEGLIEQWSYVDTVILPGPCVYEISFRGCNRNDASITNLDGGTTCFYIESILDNTIGPNTSPSFQNPAAKSFCVGQQFTWSQSAIEPDGDSIIYTQGQPWDDDDMPIPWANGFSTQEPMTTQNGFSFDPKTGLMKFTPVVPEIDVIKFVVEEYRFDTVQVQWRLIGTAIRELQIPILSQCNQLMSTGVKITQGVTTGNVTSTTDTLDTDSIIDYFGLENISNDVPSNNPNKVMLDIIGYDCYDSIVTLNVDGDLQCSTVDPADFAIIGPDNIRRPVIAVQTNCQTTLLTDSINLVLHKPLDVNGDYLLQVKKGLNDSSTIENECGFGVKEYYSMIIRVENCPDLNYGLQNVTVVEDEDIRINWYAVDSTYNAKLFDNWNIWRARRDNEPWIVATVDDPSARTFLDTNIDQSDVDRDYFEYAVQLIQNGNTNTSWTNRINSIRLTDTIKGDSTGFDWYWTEYDGWNDSLSTPHYEVFISKADTSLYPINWVPYVGIDSNFFTTEYIFPEDLDPDTLGMYLVKVMAYDSLAVNDTLNFDTANGAFVSESNWIPFELFDPENPEPPIEITDLVIPNIMTPNGDNMNSSFALKPGPYGGENDEIHITIYNRWGKMVHEFAKPPGSAYDPDNAWEGHDMATGKIVSDGVYYYIIRFTDGEENVSREMKGHLTVIGGGTN